MEKPISDHQDPLSSSSSSSSNGIKVEEEKVDNLLEKAWFFGNSLNNNTRPKKNIPNDQNRPKHNNLLARTPSLPVYFGKASTQKEENETTTTTTTTNGASKLIKQKSLTTSTNNHKAQQQQRDIGSSEEEEKSTRGSTSIIEELKKKKKKNEIVRMRKAKTNVKPVVSSGGLLRADSVPITAFAIKEEEEEDEIPDEESYARLSNLIRQALPEKTSHSSPLTSPRIHVSKDITQSSNTPKTHVPSQNTIWETINSNSAKNTNRPQPLNKSGLRRTMTSLEFDEVEGFKDKTLTAFKKDMINTNKPPTTPPPAGLNKISSKDFPLDPKDNMKMPTRKLGRTQSYSPQIPSSLIKQPTAEDMKEQLKYWARSVACNIQQD
ncbi:hypothetical protein ACFE04_024193 [Oxalis oulophora]